MEGGDKTPTHSHPITGRRLVVSTVLWLLYTKERPHIHCMGGWVGLRAGLGGIKISPPSRFSPQTIQLVVSHFTDYTILAAAILSAILNFHCCSATHNHTGFYPLNDFLVGVYSLQY